MANTIRGEFEAKLAPRPTHDLAAGSSVDGRQSATSIGEMQSARAPLKGSAVYVVIERVTGALNGKAGSFVLMHPEVTNRRIPSDGAGDAGRGDRRTDRTDGHDGDRDHRRGSTSTCSSTICRQGDRQAHARHFPVSRVDYMQHVRVESFSISIDGFGAGADQSLENPLGVGRKALHGWAFTTRTFRQMFGQDGG
jgi:hypothetical protein